MNEKRKLIDFLNESKLKYEIVTETENDTNIEIVNDEVNFIQASIHEDWQEYIVTFSVSACEKLGYEILDEEYAEECDEQGIAFDSVDEVIEEIKKVI